MQMQSMIDLMGMTLQEIYNAENQMLGAAPALIAAASSPLLAEMLERHARTTEEQIRRLGRVMARYGGNGGNSSATMQALLSEARRIADMDGDPDVKDAALIMAQQRVEHDEIACYGTAVSMAKLLGDEESARLLEQTLDEEEKTDRALSDLAKSKINPAADAAAPSA